MVHSTFQGMEMISKLDSRTQVMANDKITLAFDMNKCHFLMKNRKSYRLRGVFMSKIIKCITLAVVMLLIVTACGPNRSKEDIDKALNKDNSKDKPNQLTMWVDGDKQMAFYKKLRINILKTGIKVKLVNIGQNDQLENISLDAPAGKGPDIFFLAHDNTGSAYLQGLAAEIKLSKDELKGFNKQALKAMNYDNKQLALPAIVETTALFYNKN